MDTKQIKHIVEAALLAAGRPLSIDQLRALFGEENDGPTRQEVRAAVLELQKDYANRGIVVHEVASGYRVQINAAMNPWLSKLWEERPPRYSRALLETLAIIAYRQPITRGDIEEVRGVVVSTNIMRSLLEREWIRVVGHRDVPGRPAIFATTKTFLDYFDLSSLDELPTLSEIKDLDKLSEELDLGADDLIQPRTLSLETEDTETTADADDAILEDVTKRVNEIQENIKSMFREPEDGSLDDELDEDQPTETEGSIVAESESDESVGDSVTDDQDSEKVPDE